MGHAYEFGLGGDVDAAQALACLRALVERGCTRRVRAIADEDVLEAARITDAAVVRTLSATEAAPILTACAQQDGELAYDDALLLDEGLQDLEVPGYGGPPFTLTGVADRERGFEVGGVAVRLAEVREAIGDARAAMTDDPECRAGYAESVRDLSAFAAALVLCERFDLLLRTWE